MARHSPYRISRKTTTGGQPFTSGKVYLVFGNQNLYHGRDHARLLEDGTTLRRSPYPPMITPRFAPEAHEKTSHAHHVQTWEVMIDVVSSSLCSTGIIGSGRSTIRFRHQKPRRLPKEYQPRSGSPLRHPSDRARTRAGSHSCPERHHRRGPAKHQTVRLAELYGPPKADRRN